MTIFTSLIFIKHNHTPVVKSSSRELSYTILIGRSFATKWVKLDKDTGSLKKKWGKLQMFSQFQIFKKNCCQWSTVRNQPVFPLNFYFNTKTQQFDLYFLQVSVFLILYFQDSLALFLSSQASQPILQS